MICEARSVGIVLFPFVDSPVTKARPAVVLSTGSFNAAEGATVLVMITTAAQSWRANDVSITDWQGAGLRGPCFVRMKIFTVDNGLIGRIIGQLGDVDWRKTQAIVDASLSLR